MCYSGKCRFERYDGECMIYNYESFKEKYGECACTVGGHITCLDDEIYYIENEGRLRDIYMRWLEDKDR